MKSRIKRIWKKNRSLTIFLVLMFVFRSSIADWNVVPTGSMKPTILEGDRILVNKMAYDLRVPFTHISLLKISDPRRGDIIVFDSEASDQRLVKRVVGVPGDRVRLTDNTLYINGRRLSYQDLRSRGSTSDRIEHLPGAEHLIRIRKEGSPFSSFGTVDVPPGYYLALGDNRDNSADSRVIGFVPRDEIVGRSGKVVMSLDYDDYYLPRRNRFMHDLGEVPSASGESTPATE
jgi:signal peptidase I